MIALPLKYEARSTLQKNVHLNFFFVCVCVHNIVRVDIWHK